MSDKASIRLRMSALLQQQRSTLQALTDKICHHLREQLAPIPTASVAFYNAFWDEVDLTQMMCAHHANGGIVLLPAVQQASKILAFRRWTPETICIPGPQGTTTPPPTNPIITPTHVLTPLRAFDGAGHRLGRGGGYYDATLTHLRSTNPNLIAWGIAFEMQRVSVLPLESHDARLNGIITEAGFYDI